MSEANATLEQAASETPEQPAAEQTVDTSVVDTAGQDQAEPKVEAPVTPAPKLYAGKYKTVEELESAYKNTSSESSRMASELAQFRKPAKAEPESKPQYTADQLESWKENRLLEVSQHQAGAQKAYADGDYQRAQQLDAQARESARQIRLIDAELRKMDIASTFQSNSKKSAEGRLLNEAVTVLKQYQSDLTPGTDLYSKASEFMDGYQAMGLDIENPLVQAQAVSMAAQILGLSSIKVAQSTRKELTNTLNQALKQSVITGGGKSSKSGTGTVDFMKMSDAEFRAYKAQRGWD